MFNGLHKLLASIRQRPSPSENSGRASAIPEVRSAAAFSALRVSAVTRAPAATARCATAAPT